MISCNLVRQSLKTLAPALFLLFCCSIGAFAQSSESQGAEEMAKKISFTDTSLKAAVKTIGNQLKLNVVFDETVKDSDKLTIELRDVSIEQALKIVLVAKRLQARVIEKNTIIVFPDNATNRQRYEQYELWPVKSDGNK